MAKAGLVVAGAVLALVALFLLTLAFHWFQLMLLLIGLGALVAGVAIPDGPLPVQGHSLGVLPPAPDLRSRLGELDALREDGTLSAAEHRRKRKQLIDAWSSPPRRD